MATAKKKVKKTKKIGGGVNLMTGENMNRWKSEFWVLMNKNVSLLREADCDNTCENCNCSDEQNDKAFDQTVDDMFRFSDQFADAVDEKDKLCKFLDFAME
jgi:hypothetical protein